MKQYNQVFTTSLPVDLLASDLYKVLCEQVDNIEPAQQEYYTRVAEAIIDPIADNSQACAHLFNTINGWVKLPTPFDDRIEDVEQAVQGHIETINHRETVGADLDIDTPEQKAETIDLRKNRQDFQVGDYVCIAIHNVNTFTNYGDITFAENTNIQGTINAFVEDGTIQVKYSAIRRGEIVEFFHTFPPSLVRVLPKVTGVGRLNKYLSSLEESIE